MPPVKRAHALQHTAVTEMLRDGEVRGDRIRDVLRVCGKSRYEVRLSLPQRSRLPLDMAIPLNRDCSTVRSFFERGLSRRKAISRKRHLCCNPGSVGLGSSTEVVKSCAGASLLAVIAMYSAFLAAIRLSYLSSLYRVH